MNNKEWLETIEKNKREHDLSDIALDERLEREGKRKQTKSYMRKKKKRIVILKSIPYLILSGFSGAASVLLWFANWGRLTDFISIMVFAIAFTIGVLVLDKIDEA